MTTAETRATTTYVGKPLKRREDAALLRGRGRYVDDFLLAGQLYLAFARSPYPHARILRVDTAAARALPGVVDVVTGQDLRDLPVLLLNQRLQGMQLPPNPVM